MDESSNLSEARREHSQDKVTLHAQQVRQSQIGNDKPIKSTIRLYDGSVIEGVLIQADARVTECVS